MWIAVFGGIAGMFALVGGDANELHQLLFVCGGGFAVWKTLALTMEAFAEERRNRTLELLFLAGLSAGEVFLMKLAGGMAVVATHLVGILPFQAFPFLAGGLSEALFVSTIAALVLLTFFFFSVGALGSALCREESSALFVALLFVFGIGVFPLLLAYGGAFFSAPLAFSVAAVSADWLRFCPGYLVILVLDQLQNFPVSEVRYVCGATLGWGIVLSWAAFLAVGASAVEAPSLTIMERLRARLDARRRLRAQWLERDPSAWLVLRDGGVVWLMRGGLAVCVLLMIFFIGYGERFG